MFYLSFASKLFCKFERMRFICFSISLSVSVLFSDLNLNDKDTLFLPCSTWLPLYTSNNLTSSRILYKYMYNFPSYSSFYSKCYPVLLIVCVCVWVTSLILLVQSQKWAPCLLQLCASKIQAGLRAYLSFSLMTSSQQL